MLGVRLTGKLCTKCNLSKLPFIPGVDVRVLGTHFVQETGKLACDRRFTEAMKYSNKGVECLQELEW